MNKYAIGAIAVVGIALAAFAQPAPLTVNGEIGENATVEGVVDEVYTAHRSGATFLDMGGTYPNNSFTAVIWPEDAAKFSGLTALEGKKVVITGRLRLYNGKQEIILRNSNQLKTD
ncbi:MAG TPA: hypothetical protein VHD95_07665 [Rhizomicrobium sp.]|jgi:DNA/RNA endonuclease YhcR with UshA esterase domain|nr:hypothetical protein [Rhizomicrobium sp.]